VIPGRPHPSYRVRAPVTLCFGLMAHPWLVGKDISVELGHFLFVND